jgi:decaprenyl-phosphate phosphoribosyltransferase
MCSDAARPAKTGVRHSLEIGGTMNPYIKIARIDHWFKNAFMIPGTVLAMLLVGIPFGKVLLPSLIALLSTCLVASANYVINEFLDAEFDRHHPVKWSRPSAAGNVKPIFVYLEYFLFAAAGLGLASLLTREFLLFSAALLAMGVVYNVRPFRSKDRVYLDVLSESVNNPLRFLLGWSAIVSGYLPPSSILMAYWMGGAFLMAVKRYAEYRFIADPEKAGLYRRSFLHYTEQKLLLSSVFYALTSSFFLGIFLIKYRIELMLSFPLFAVLFVWYLAIGMRPHSPTKDPEKFYRERGFMAYVVFLAAAVWLLLIVNIPMLNIFVERVKY